MGHLWIKYTQLVDILLINGNSDSSFSPSILVGQEKMPFLSIFQHSDPPKAPTIYFLTHNWHTFFFCSILGFKQDIVCKNWNLNKKVMNFFTPWQYTSTLINDHGTLAYLSKYEKAVHDGVLSDNVSNYKLSSEISIRNNVWTWEEILGSEWRWDTLSAAYI